MVEPDVIVLQRTKTSEHSTIGTMEVFGTKVYTLEDPRRQHKSWGETRIPSGRYELKLRTEGGMHSRYLKRFGDLHQGMLWLQDVPMFEWVYIHIGNRPADTEGCILVGRNFGTDCVMQSTTAYKLIYPKIVGAINAGYCFLEIQD